jgi:hypothetical protein
MCYGFLEVNFFSVEHGVVSKHTPKQNLEQKRSVGEAECCSSFVLQTLLKNPLRAI